ncbi:MAG: hypothetical protein ACI835_003741 [Planctomycetota bacterium]|jgi:hypothetical protein
MCQKVVAAVGELETEFTGRVSFNVISAEETAKATKDLEAYGFAEARHGLVAFDEAGEAAVKLPGHQFGKDEIKAAIDQVLAAN